MFPREPNSSSSPESGIREIQLGQSSCERRVSRGLTLLQGSRTRYTAQSKRADDEYRHDYPPNIGMNVYRMEPFKGYEQCFILRVYEFNCLVHSFTHSDFPGALPLNVELDMIPPARSGQTTVRRGKSTDDSSKFGLARLR